MYLVNYILNSLKEITHHRCMCVICKKVIHNDNRLYCSNCIWYQLQPVKLSRQNILIKLLNKAKIDFSDLHYIRNNRNILMKLALCRVFINHYNVYDDTYDTTEEIKEQVDLINSKIMEYYKIFFTLNLFQTKVHEFIL